MRGATWQNLWVPATLIALIIGRIGLQIALYQAGFLALTADEFGRTLIAADWSRSPELYWSGFWLPFHTYLFGGALALRWELLWIPRFVAITAGIASIIVMYLLGRALTNSRIVGIVSAGLMSLNPAHIWLSSTGLTEIPNALLVLITLWAAIEYLKDAATGRLLFGAGALALANGFRFESWVLSAFFSLLIATLVIRQYRHLKPKQITWLLVAAAIPWVFPVAWLIGNYVETQNPLYFIESIRAYKFDWYGANVSYQAYLDTFWNLDPYLTCLGVFGIIALSRSLPEIGVRYYAIVAIVPLVLYIVLQGGQVEPPANYIRYFSLYIFLLYPAVAYVFIRLLQLIPKRSHQWIAAAICLTIVMLTQSQAAFRFVNDASASGVVVGQAIRTIRAQNPAIAKAPMIVELAYWKYLAIHVGANDPYTVLFDRPINPSTRDAPSLLISDQNAFLSCLRTKQVSYLVLRDPGLQAIAEHDLQLRANHLIDGYRFYPLTAADLQRFPGDQDQPCTLYPSE